MGLKILDEERAYMEGWDDAIDYTISIINK